MKVCFTDIDDPIWCLFGCANKVKNYGFYCLHEIILILKNTIINVRRDGDNITISPKGIYLGYYNYWWCPLKFSFAHSCVVLKVLNTIMSCVAERCYKICIKNQFKQKDFDTSWFYIFFKFSCPRKKQNSWVLTAKHFSK